MRGLLDGEAGVAEQGLGDVGGDAFSPGAMEGGAPVCRGLADVEGFDGGQEPSFRGGAAGDDRGQAGGLGFE